MREITARLDRHEQHVAASRTERSSVTAADTFIPHGLSEQQLTELRVALASEPALVRAELARKELKHFPEQKLFLLCVSSRRRWFGLPDADGERALAGRLSKRLQLSGRLLVFAPHGSFRAIARRLRAVPGARIEERD